MLEFCIYMNVTDFIKLFIITFYKSLHLEIYFMSVYEAQIKHLASKHNLAKLVCV